MSTHHPVTHHHLLVLFTCAAVGALVFMIISLYFGWIQLPPHISTEALPVPMMQ